MHLVRNVCAPARNRRERALLGSVMRTVFAESAPALVRELYHLAVDEIGAVSAAAGALLGEAEADALAYLDFPPAHHRRLRTNNVQERVNREIKRRANVVQVLPSRKSLTLLQKGVQGIFHRLADELSQLAAHGGLVELRWDRTWLCLLA